MIRQLSFSALFRRYHWFILFLSIIVPAVLLLGSTRPALASIDPAIHTQDPNFPIYTTIKPNVDFWIRIFSEVSKYEGLVHDTQNLDLVYGKIKLHDANTLTGRKKNKKLKKQAINKYKSILLGLSKGGTAKTAESMRIKAMFGADASPDAYKNAAYRIRIQTGLKEEFIGGLERSGAFIDEFRKIFRYHGLPEDLVYLPCVESSYRYKAYSKFGAAGIWQFTRSTGRLYMEIGYVVDERRDPFISTNAAARLLKKNFTKLNDWPLAITAYNHGLNGMHRAKNAHGSYEKVFRSYKSPSFRFASRNFYSEFLAARHVAKKYKDYFGQVNFKTPMKFHTITTKGYLPADAAASALDIKKSVLQQMNPALRPPVFNGQKHIPPNYKLKLPYRLDRNMAGDRLAGIYLKKQKPSRFHRVRKGDTAGAIARLHQVSLNELIMINGLNRRATIYVGQNLRIPVKDEIVSAKAGKTALVQARKTVHKKMKVAKKEIVSKAQPPILAKVEKPVETAAISPPPRKASAKVPPPVVIERKIIRENKPLTADASSSGNKAAQTANGTPPAEEIVTAGEEFSIPVNPEIVIGDLKFISTRVESGRAIGIIKVQPEETLGHYSDWLGIKTQSIRRLNNFKYGRPIAIDQTVKLPLPTVEGIIQSFEEKRYEYHKEMEEDFFESYVVQDVETYKIKRGDSIWNLTLNELEVPIWLLKKYNPETDFSVLIPMRRINYPVIGKRIPN